MLADILDFHIILLLRKQFLQIRVMVVVLHAQQKLTSLKDEEEDPHTMLMGQLKFKMY